MTTRQKIITGAGAVLLVVFGAAVAVRCLATPAFSEDLYQQIVLGPLTPTEVKTSIVSLYYDQPECPSGFRLAVDSLLDQAMTEDVREQGK